LLLKRGYLGKCPLGALERIEGKKRCSFLGEIGKMSPNLENPSGF
jgi:hypothetical protein